MLILDKLEDTTLYDAALAVDIAEAMSENSDADAPDNIDVDDVMTDTVGETVNELVIVDAAVAEQESFIQDQPGVEYYIVGQDESINDVADKIASFNNLNAIHLITHGDTGAIILSGQLINSDTAESNLSLFDAIKGSLNETGDLLLYGCDVAQDSGIDFINLVSQLTESDVSASDDVTGHSSLGGDWDLEVEVGEVETEEKEYFEYEDDLATYNIQPGQSRVAPHRLSKDTPNDDSFQSATFSINPPPGRTLSHRVIPPSGSANRPDNVNYTYVADPTYEGVVTVTTRWKMVSSGRGGSITTFENRTDTFIIAFPNARPTGQDQEISGTEDTPFTFQESDFSTGFADADADDVFERIRIDSLPSGSLELNGSAVSIGDIISAADIANLEYQGVQDAFGDDVDSFQFSVGDDQSFSSTSNTMTIDLAAVNDAPIIRTGSPADTGVAGADETTAEDNSLTLTLSDYVIDVDGDLLTLDGAGSATNGTVIDNGDGTITFTPDANFFGSDSLVLTVTDGEFDVAITIPVEVTPVNDAPTSQNQSVTATEDLDFTFQESDFSAGYFDVEGEALSSIRIDSLPNGTFELNGSAVSVGDEIAVADLSNLVYRAPENQNGDDFTSFEFSVSDGTDFSDSSFTMIIDVNAVNDAPVLRPGSPADTGVAGADETTAEDNSLTLTLSDYVIDVDGDLLTLDGAGSATNGTVIDNGDGTITFTPDANFFGSDSLVLTVTDGEFDVAITIPVEVTPVNDAPTSQNQSVTATEDLDFTFQESDFSAGYFDIEGEALSSIRIDSLPNGTFELNGSAVNVGDEIAVADIGNLVYRAPENQSGDDFTSFEFSVSDGTDFSDSSFTMTIDVTAVNDAPILRPGSPADTGVAGADETTPEDTPLTLNLNDYVIDVDGDLLILDGDGSATNGTVTDNGDGTITYSPDLNYFGSDSVVLTVTDGEFDVAITIPIEITAVNDAPTAVDDITSTEVNTTVIVDALANDSDVEGDSIFISRIISSPDGVANTDGNSIEFTPNNNFVGTATIVYEISDGDKVSTAEVSVEISIPDAFNGLADLRSTSSGEQNSDAFGDDDGKVEGEILLNLNEGEYSVQIGNDSKNSSGLSNEESQMTDGEYTVLSLNEQPFSLHDTNPEPSDSEQLQTEIQNLISAL